MMTQNRHLRRRSFAVTGRFILLLMGALGIVSGCARDQYFYGLKVNGTQQLAPCECDSTNPLAAGGHHPRVDKIERVVQAPRHFFKKRFGSDEQGGLNFDQRRWRAVASAQEYLAANGLDDISIDTRRYEPKQQWRRLKQNDLIAPFWKYTAGTLDVVGYTLLPRRALHSDVYSPFTNTLSINSDEPSSVLYEAARAKEYRKQRWLGTYAVLLRAPVAGLIHHAGAATDVLTYAQVTRQRGLARELYPNAYAELGSAAISDALFLAPLPADTSPLVTPLVKLAGRATGRIAGQVMAKREESKAGENNGPAIPVEDQVKAAR